MAESLVAGNLNANVSNNSKKRTKISIIFNAQFMDVGIKLI